MKESLIGELVKRATQSGLDKIFLTEETLRKALGEKVPKDSVNILLNQLKSSREELAKWVLAEMLKMLSHINLREELKALVEDTVIEIRTDISFGGKTAPETTSTKVALRSRRQGTRAKPKKS